MAAEPTPETVLPVSEETLHVEKSEREVGRVRVSVTTETIDEVIEETLRTRSAQVERVAVGREVSDVPKIREENGILFIPVVEEILVVEKRLYLKEEIQLRFSDREETVRHPVQRRVQHPVIERVPSGPADEASAAIHSNVTQTRDQET